MEVKDYSEHALTEGWSASAVAYIECAGPDGTTWWGVGRDSSILDASLSAVVSAANDDRDLDQALVAVEAGVAAVAASVRR